MAPSKVERETERTFSRVSLISQSTSYSSNITLYIVSNIMRGSRARTMTEDSYPSTSYLVMADEEGEMNLTQIDDRPLPRDLFMDTSSKQQQHVQLEDEDDEDLTPFLLSTQPTKINGLNMLNVATYMVHLFVSYGVGVWGLDGLVSTRVQVSQKYETLVTPESWTYYIWIPILMTETVFVIAQLFPEYRSRPIIQQGTSFFFFYTCLLQTGWTLFFAFECFIGSFVCVVLSVISLASLLTSQHLAQVGGRQSHEEFWFFRFPFCLHFGWMTVMAAVHFSLLIRYVASNHIETQLASDIVAMGILLPIACFFLLQTDGHNFIIPAVILYSYVGMATRLHNPSDKLVEDYGEMVVSAVRQSLYFCIGIVASLLGPRLFIWVCNEFYTIRVINFNDEDRSSFWNGV